MAQQKPSTICFTRQQGQSLVFETVTGEKIVIEFKKCKYLRSEVVLTMHPSVVVTRGELLADGGKYSNS